uniref:Uncharacterized protein n=1 Tax=Anguilla anguilla TaxID=7936 RepID=A0A0E9VB09_ANGAN
MHFNSILNPKVFCIFGYISGIYVCHLWLIYLYSFS